MRIKNTKELVLRAQGHARQDHIQQGTYGDARLNGHTEYQGCAIACLAAPHRKRDLRTWIKSHMSKAPSVSYHPTKGSYTYRSVSSLLKGLQQEFGINVALARAAEAIFEAMPTHGAAIEFIPAFAKALPEGADVNPRSLIAWWKKNIGRADRFGVGSYNFDVYDDENWAKNTPDDDPYPATVEEASDRFLGYLKGLK